MSTVNLDNCLVLAPKSLHLEYMEARLSHPDWDFSIMTLEEAERLFRYNYDNRALRYLLKKGIAYEKASQILEISTSKSLPLAAEKPFELEILSWQKELLDNGLLFELAPQNARFSARHVIIDGYHDGSRLSRLLGELGGSMAVSFALSNQVRMPSVFSFADQYEEVHYLMNVIAEEIGKGQDPGKIAILGASDEHYKLMRDFAPQYGFLIEEKSELRLFDTVLYRDFQKKAREIGCVAAFDWLLEKGGAEADCRNLRALLVKLGPLLEEEVGLKALDEMAKLTSSSVDRYENEVHVVSSLNVPPDWLVHVVNFNLGTFPKSHREVGFYRDELLGKISFPTSSDKINEDKRTLKSLLSSGQVKTVSRAEYSTEGETIISPLAAGFGMEVEEAPALDFEYAHDKGTMFTCFLRDWKTDYGMNDPRLLTRHPAEFRTYDPSFRPFEGSSSGIKRKYSASSLAKFIDCKYSYYLDKGLNLSSFDGNFSARVGEILHSMMEDLSTACLPGSEESSQVDCLSKYRRKIEEEDNEKPFTPLEKILLKNLEERAKRVWELHFRRLSTLPNVSISPEKSFEFPLKNRDGAKIIGRYDALIEYGEGNENFYYILDYKSGKVSFNADEFLKDGLNPQLPVYASYAFQEPFLKDKKLMGMYIAPLLDDVKKGSKDKTLDELRTKKLAIKGVFSNYLEGMKKLNELDGTTNFVSGFLTKNDGTLHKNSLKRARDNDGFIELSEKALSLLGGMDMDIMRGNFEIRPYRSKKADACKYCEFKDVCYMKQEVFDKELIDEEDDETGEDRDGEMD